jgi:hypothetical protein
MSVAEVRAPHKFLGGPQLRVVYHGWAFMALWRNNWGYMTAYRFLRLAVVKRTVVCFGDSGL